MKDITGNIMINKDHAYYYQTQQQPFTVKQKKYCDFIVCAFDGYGTPKFLSNEMCQMRNTGILFYQNLKPFGAIVYFLRS